MPITSDFFKAKHIRSEGYTAAQALVLESQIRERSFWSSGVNNAKLLAEIKGCISDTLDGKLSKEESLIKMYEAISASGYKTPSGKEGGLHDLLSDRRQKIILNTNIEMAQGYMRKAEALENLEIFPCQELVRGRASKVPRNWKNIWAANGGKFYGGRMIAKTTDPIWKNINDFGNDYPPFKWNSGMTVEHIDREEAVELGVITPKELLGEAAENEKNNAVIESINCDVKANFGKVANAEGEIPEETKRFIKKRLSGFWEGTYFKCPDSNGTTPYYPKDLAVVVGMDKSANSQYSAVIKWFTKEGNRGYKYIQENPNSPEAVHLNNFVNRSIPIPSTTAVYRGLGFDSKNEFDNFVNTIKTQGYVPRYKFESFTTSRKFAQDISYNKPYRVVLIVKKHSRFADIGAVAEYFNSKTAKEAEVLPQIQKTLKVLKIRPNGIFLEVEVEQ